MASKKTTDGTSTRRPGGPAAKSATSARPRIKASHSEKAVQPRGDAAGDVRRKRARDTVRALGPRGTTKRALPDAAPRRPLSDAKPARDGAAAGRRKSLPPPSAGPSAAVRELAIAIAAAGLEKKAIGVEVIDVSGRVDYADFLIVMTGTSDRHVHAIAMGIEASLKKKRVVPLGVEGLGSASWVLIDFDDVVVHVFQEDTRRLYDIEGLWMDAGRLDVPDQPQA